MTRVSMLHAVRAFSSVGMCALMLGMGGVPASAQSMPDMENGRYTLSPAADGFVRLDTRTGAISFCANNIVWICRAAPDERAALDMEIGRLQTENNRLRKQLSEQAEPASGKTDDRLLKGDLEKGRPASGDTTKPQAEAAKPAAPAAATPDRTGTETSKSPDSTTPPGPQKSASQESPRPSMLLKLQLPSQQRMISALDDAWRNLVAMAARMQRQFADKT